MPDLWKLETLKSGNLELVVLPGIGGRLWDIVFQGRSLLFQNTDLEDLVPDLENLQVLPTRSPQFEFPLWGGEKTWIAPDKNWPAGAPFSALDSGPYEIAASSKSHITLQSTICPQSKLQVEREISIIDGTEWIIRHSVINQGRHDQDVGIWSVMMLNHKVRIGVTGNDLNTNSVFGQPEGFVLKERFGVICDCNEPGEFKVGIENRSARTLMHFDQDDRSIWMSCDAPVPTLADKFAHIHPLEVFNSGDYPYCEAEWHAPLQRLSQGGTAEFTQHFTVWAGDPSFSPTKTEMELMSCMS